MEGWSKMLTRREAVELGLLGTLAAAFRPAFAAGNPVAAGKGEFADSVLADMKLRKIKIRRNIKVCKILWISY